MHESLILSKELKLIQSESSSTCACCSPFLPYQLSIAKRLVKIVLVEMFCNLTKRVSLKRLKLIKINLKQKVWQQQSYLVYPSSPGR